MRGERGQVDRLRAPRRGAAHGVPIQFEHQRDPVAYEMAVFAARDWDAFVAHDAKVRADPTAIRRTVVVDGEVVGWIGSFGKAERGVSYWYDRAVWG